VVDRQATARPAAFEGIGLGLMVGWIDAV